ncbi:hypothetical protein WP39_13090 [Streptomyces sp. 604F]|uniref:hypothetical protein n=1 Tax=unclassified Streptomyces TaxID=2593676 RepID=UPI001396F76B|nr:hypothetical protein [Streptomyces sp. 604F]MBP3078369.1 hypothetical protein [Streptomyces sp. 604F]QHV86537.1 hypothetical protein C3K23_17965 [Streptomyces sp. 604F]
MPTTTMLDQATAMIENAWGQPIEALEVLGVRRPSEDPLLHCAMHTRAALAITDSAVTVHQDRLHALSRHGYVPDPYELDRITETAVKLRVAHAESRAYLQATRRVVEARGATAPEVEAPAVRLAQATVARSGKTRHAPGAAPEPSSPAAVVGPSAPTTGPRR